MENSLRRGIGSYYELGQLLAMPALLDRPEISAVPVTGLPLPGQPGFDPWCLTESPGSGCGRCRSFTFDVPAEGMPEGGPFTRRLLAGPFHFTNKVDYCAPRGD